MKIADLSDIDQKTLDLRGASGGFKPERINEIALCREALSDGATEKLAWWDIEDYPRAAHYRAQAAIYAAQDVDEEAADAPR